jgi:hypothetical protein
MVIHGNEDTTGTGTELAYYKIKYRYTNQGYSTGTLHRILIWIGYFQYPAIFCIRHPMDIRQFKSAIWAHTKYKKAGLSGVSLIQMFE